MQDRIEVARSLLSSDPNHVTRAQLWQFTHNICSIYGFHPSRRRGQHFLVSPELLQCLLLNAHLTPNDIILEIGGGIGTLSLFLASQVKKLIIIEHDPRLIEFLSVLLRDFNNVLILRGDACRLAWPSFDKLVSNLPYQISSPITLKLLDKQFSSAIITVQFEFANRLLAIVGDPEYSRISVQSNLFFETEMLLRVGKEAFFPAPKVNSAVVKITPRRNAPKPDLELFERFLSILFSRKNKKVVNNLVPHFKQHDTKFGQLIEKVLYLHKIQDKRSSKLFPHEILQLFNNLAITFQAHGFKFKKTLLQ